MLDTAKIKFLAHMLETHETIEPDNPFVETLGFDMETWAPTHADCGTAACIAGWACALWTDLDPAFWDDHHAAEILGLDRQQAWVLFQPGIADRPDGVTLETITREHAARTLNHLAETGHVDWSVGVTE